MLSEIAGLLTLGVQPAHWHVRRRAGGSCHKNLSLLNYFLYQLLLPLFLLLLPPYPLPIPNSPTLHYDIKGRGVRRGGLSNRSLQGIIDTV